MNSNTGKISESRVKVTMHFLQASVKPVKETILFFTIMLNA